MRKIKLFSTIATLCMLLAMLSFGVLAASTVTLSISSTVSFDVSDVSIIVYYGLNGTGENGTHYYSRPKTGQTGLPEEASFGNMEFTETLNTCTYYLTVENMHSMTIYLKFDYEWTAVSKYILETNTSPVTVTAKVAEMDETTQKFDFTTTGKFNALTNTSSLKSGVSTETEKITGSTDSVPASSTGLQIKGRSVTRLKIDLSLKTEAMNYKLASGSGMKIRLKASLDPIESM